jgi:hypothetical protein
VASVARPPAPPLAYQRTTKVASATNVGRDKDSEQRQRVAIESYAKAAGYTIVDWFYDPAAKGSDAVTRRPRSRRATSPHGVSSYPRATKVALLRGLDGDR